MEIKIVNKKLSELKPAPYNPRIDLQPGDAEYEKLKRSVKEFGLVETVVWNEATGYVVGGHQRLKVLQDLGYNEIPVSVVSLSDEKEKALNVALNKISGDWDMPLLKDLLLELDTGEFDVTLSGFDLEEIEDLMTQVFIEEDSEEPHEDNFDVDEVLKEPSTVSSFGDVWQLGEHRLIVGDSTKEDDIFRLMNQDEANMIFTDPPYNVAYKGSTTEKLTIANDDMADEDFYNFLLNAFTAAFKVTKAGGAIYICHADLEGLNFRKSMIDSGWLLKQCLIWVKNSLVLGRQDYQWKHEPILYGWKPGAAHNWYGDRKQTTVIEDDAGITIADHGDHSIVTFFNGEQTVALKVKDVEVLSGDAEQESTIWRIDKPKRNGDHPTMKPIVLCANAILKSSKQGDIVLDMFGGSGSTLMACEQTKRKCRTVEFDPKYADVIIRRWETFTEKKAVRLN